MRAACLATVAAAALALGGCVPTTLTFQCTSDASCGDGGRCIQGACALVDVACPLGFRFDRSAAGDRGGQCVDQLDGKDMSVGDQGLPTDLAGDQGLPTDLAGPCVPMGAEDCYNGVDDDCNGKVDCEDSACTPIAECVQDAPGFKLGTYLAATGTCPGQYSASTTPLNQGLSAPAACEGCTATPTVVCSTTVRHYAAASCPGTVVETVQASSSQACVLKGTGLNWTSTNVGVTTMTPTASCPPSGTPRPAPLTWQQQNQFCETQRKGAGCAPGNVCVPKLSDPGLKHCALVAGEFSCPGNYAAEGGALPWYAGVNDTRTCGTTCSFTPSGGTCGTSFVRVYGTNNCTGGNNLIAGGTDGCGVISPINSVKVELQNATPPSCQPNNTSSGTATPIDRQTLCCL